MSYYAPTDAPAPATSVVRNLGRGQVITPQSLIVVQGRARSDEMQRRKRIAMGNKNLLAPATDDSRTFNIFKGQLCFCILDHGMTFRGHPGTDSAAHVEVVANMAGLPASELERLGMPAVIQVTRDVGSSPGSDERTTLVVRGTQTIVHTGMDDIRVGQVVLADPFAAVTTINGQTVPAIEVEGVPRGFAPPALRGLDSATVYSMVSKYKEWLRKELGNSATAAALSAAADSTALGTELMKLVKNVRVDDRLAQHMPVVGYLGVWLAWFYMKQMDIEGRPTRALHAMKALHHRLCVVETEFSNIARDYDSSLPHNTRPKTAAQQPRSERSVRSVDVTTATIIAKFSGDKKAATKDMLKLKARLDLFTHEYLEIFLHEQVAWLKRFEVGLALSSTSKAQPLDIAMGQR